MIYSTAEEFDNKNKSPPLLCASWNQFCPYWLLLYLWVTIRDKPSTAMMTELLLQRWRQSGCHNSSPEVQWTRRDGDGSYTHKIHPTTIQELNKKRGNLFFLFTSLFAILLSEFILGLDAGDVSSHWVLCLTRAMIISVILSASIHESWQECSPA